MVSAHARLWALVKIHSSGKFARQRFCVLSKNPVRVGLRAQLRALFCWVPKKGVATKGSVETVPQQACAEQAVASE